MKALKEITNHPPDEILTQILANQRILLLVASEFILLNHDRMKRERWLSLNGTLIDEYHRTRELIGEESVNQFWKPEMGSWL